MTSYPLARRLRPALSGWPRGIVVAVTAIVGVGALFGGYGLLADAEGLGVRESWLDGSPFADYTVPALALLVVVAGGLLSTLALAVSGSGYAAAAAFVMALVLLGWGAVETLVIGWQGPFQLALLAVFVVLPATLLAGSARHAYTHANQGDHHVDPV